MPSPQPSIPRPEYPRPQLVRSEWLNLNGPWDFAFDPRPRGEISSPYTPPESFDQTIIVPFAPQSKLSGIGQRDVPDVVWYRRFFDVPEHYMGKKLLLHFGAVDYLSHVWVNGTYVGTHEGGHTPFSFDVTGLIKQQGNELVVRAEDFPLDLTLPRGKQYWKSNSEGIWYTPTIGIWQTVWIEPVSTAHIERLIMTPNVDRNEIDVEIELSPAARDMTVRVEISFQGHTFIRDAIKAEFVNGNVRIARTFPIRYGGHSFKECAYWSPEHPNLYDIQLTLVDDQGDVYDTVSSYFGLRKIHTDKGRVYFNNHPYKMRLVLDQGYWPDGLLTAPDDEALKRDIELAKAMGFNGARKHQKVEDPRFMYWADRLGFLVWGEMANAYQYSTTYARKFAKEWSEVIARDYNHPCIVCWVPLNESWGVDNMVGDQRQRDHATAMYYLTKSLDPTRLVISNDGWEHTLSDLLTIHDYDQDPASFERKWLDIANGLATHHPGGRAVAWNDLSDRPFLMTEYGGIAFKASEWEGWGYGGVDNVEELLRRYAALTEVLYRSPRTQGFCYTQLTDVEQEINGLLTYDRKPKAPLERIRSITLGHGDPGPGASSD